MLFISLSKEASTHSGLQSPPALLPWPVACLTCATFPSAHCAPGVLAFLLCCQHAMHLLTSMCPHLLLPLHVTSQVSPGQHLFYLQMGTACLLAILPKSPFKSATWPQYSLSPFPVCSFTTRPYTLFISALPYKMKVYLRHRTRDRGEVVLLLQHLQCLKQSLAHGKHWKLFDNRRLGKALRLLCWIRVRLSPWPASLDSGGLWAVAPSLRKVSHHQESVPSSPCCCHVHICMFVT